MRIIDVLSAPWAIVPDRLMEIQAIYATHLRGEKIDISGIEARIGKTLENDPQPYDVINGVAVFDLCGVVGKRMSLFSRISGGISTEFVRQNIMAAIDDPKVKALILNIDSPGGSVDGTAELASAIHAARGDKPIVAFTDGMMASAAYWIGSATDAIHISGNTTWVGSIGVVASHTDYSGWEQQVGVKTTEITAGKYKRVATEHAPLTQEGRQSIQDQVDYIYSVFVDAVAKHRGVSVDQVLSGMADGRLFIGHQALDAGLVDGVCTLEELIQQLAAGDAAPIPSRGPAGDAGQRVEPTKEENPMKLKFGQNTIDVEETTVVDAAFLAQHCPDIAEGFRKEGADAERQRIQGIEAQLVPGHEAIIGAMKADGKSTAADAALAIVAAEKKTRAGVLADIAADSPAALPQPVPGDAKSTDADASDAPIETLAKAAWEKDGKLRAEFGGDFKAYVAFETANAAGKVSLLSRQK
jgi:signal peptide peptidase SppA